MEATAFPYIVTGWTLLGCLTFVALLLVTAPYGRHTRAGWGPTIPRRWGWVIMESPALLLPVAYLLLAEGMTTVTLLLSMLWIVHYGNRTLVFPFRLTGGTARMPLSIVAMAVCFNLVNGYLQGRSLHGLGPVPPTDWRLILGVALFIAGWAGNVHSDELLLKLRRNSTDAGYRIPRGGLYRWVSCPNYLAEIIEWSGWAIATWSGAGLSFAVWTTANLFPRALAHHRWYREKFADYPPKRKAVLPYLL